MDVRLFYPTNDPSMYSPCKWDPNDSSIPAFWRISQQTNVQICYTEDALIYAQAAFFVTIVVTQLANNMISKTRTLSISQQRLVNNVQIHGIIFMFCVAILICYEPHIAFGLGGRSIACAHFAVPGMTWSVALFFYDELRKIFVRRGMMRIGGKVRLVGWFARNTLY
jgi:Cation transporting ATPase, C-terminus